MKLSTTAIEAITSEIRLKLALALGFREHYISRLVDANKNNGPLTTAAALQVLKKETGLNQSEILEKSTNVNTLS